MNALGRFFVLFPLNEYENGSRIPYLDNEGYAQVFESRERAKADEMKGVFGTYLREFNKAGFLSFVDSRYILGITGFRFFPRAGYQSAIVLRDGFLPKKGVKGMDVIGSEINRMIILLKQKENHSLQSASENSGAQSRLYDLLYKSVFFVPVEVFGCTDKDPSRILHVSNDGAFERCRSPEEISIPGSVGAVPSSAFERCGGLKKVVIGEGVTEIESGAFHGCDAISTLVLPGSLRRVRGNDEIDWDGHGRQVIEINAAFLGVGTIEKIVYHGTADEWEKIVIEDGNYCLLRSKIEFEPLTDGAENDVPD